MSHEKYAPVLNAIFLKKVKAKINLLLQKELEQTILFEGKKNGLVLKMFVI